MVLNDTLTAMEGSKREKNTWQMLHLVSSLCSLQLSAAFSEGGDWQKLFFRHSDSVSSVRAVLTVPILSSKASSCCHLRKILRGENTWKNKLYTKCNNKDSNPFSKPSPATQLKFRRLPQKLKQHTTNKQHLKLHYNPPHCFNSMYS